MTFGGTSASAPIAAALAAVANQARVIPIAGPQTLYSLAFSGTPGRLNGADFIDITSGCNGYLNGVLNCAVPGFDNVSGLGRPQLSGLVAQPNAQAGSCQITQGYCANYPTLVGTFEDFWGDTYAGAAVSSSACTQRAMAYYQWCGGTSGGPAGHLTTATFWQNNSVVQTQTVGTP